MHNMLDRVEEIMESRDPINATMFEDEPTRSYATEEFEAQHNDLVDVLATAHPAEALYVQKRLRAGKVDGSTYGDGTNRACACLIGTIATARGVAKDPEIRAFYKDQGTDPIAADNGVRIANATGLALGDFDMRPSEHLFMGVDPGDKPADNEAAALIDQHLTELFLSNPTVYGPRKAHGLKEAR